MSQEIDLANLLSRISKLEEEVRALKSNKPGRSQTLPDTEKYDSFEVLADEFLEQDTYEVGIYEVLLRLIRQKASLFMYILGKTLYMNISEKWERATPDKWNYVAQYVKEKKLLKFKNNHLDMQQSESYIQSLLSILQFKLSVQQRTQLSRLSRESI